MKEPALSNLPDLNSELITEGIVLRRPSVVAPPVATEASRVDPFAPLGGFPLLFDNQQSSLYSSPTQPPRSPNTLSSSSGRLRRSSSDVARKIEEGSATVLVRDPITDDWNFLLEENSLDGIRKLGAGAEADIYLAELLLDGGDKKSVVLKRLKGAVGKNSREFSVQHRLTNLHETSGEHNLLYYMGTITSKENETFAILPFCDFFLDKVIGAMNRNDAVIDEHLKQTVILTIMQDLLLALNCMHAVDIIHRDIKPQNVGYKQEGAHFCLCDFGCAVAKSDEDIIFSGTPMYMHPACFLDVKQTATEKNDLYALGIMLHELLGKEPPVVGLRELTRSKATEYNKEKERYAYAQKAQLEKRKEEQCDIQKHSKIHLSYPHFIFTKVRPVNVYPTLRDEMSGAQTINDKLLIVAMHLTRCFEAPNIKQVINAFNEIKQSLMAKSNLDPEALAAKRDLFYYSLMGQKTRSYHSESTLRDSPLLCNEVVISDPSLIVFS